MRPVPPEPSPIPNTVCVILAGGRARRLGGGDKALRSVGGCLLLARILSRLSQQVAVSAINANGDPARFAAFGLPVVADTLPDQPGPLAGVLAALDWAAAAYPDHPWLLTIPGDTPFLPLDLALRLHDARAATGHPIACAGSGGRIHPTIAIWPVRLRHTLREALLAGERTVGRFAERQGAAIATWPAVPHDPFFNVNTPQQLAEAERILAAMAPIDEPGPG